MNGYTCTAGTLECRYCETIKPCADFTPSRSTRGHTLRCKDCTKRIAHDTYVAAHPDYQPPPADIRCRWCGLQFRPTRDRATYCSNACSFAARRRPDASAVYFPTCTHCGRTFTAQRNGRKYCSKECGWRHIYPDTLVKPRPFDCVDCGNNFTQRHGNNPRCQRCAAAHLDANRQAAKALRRTRQRQNGTPERISRQAIYARDNWSCYLCGAQVDRQAAPTDPLSPTLDHVMPLALGGTHTADNLRLACRQCNLTKGATFLVTPPMTRAKRKTRLGH